MTIGTQSDVVYQAIVSEAASPVHVVNLQVVVNGIATQQ
jgi:hypothetical protein